jgi:hypothetical protein
VHPPLTIRVIIREWVVLVVIYIVQAVPEVLAVLVWIEEQLLVFVIVVFDLDVVLYLSLKLRVAVFLAVG